MSHIALRRVMIRMLHDPSLAEAVRVDAARALEDVDLTAEERGWLAAAPAEAWCTDPDRPRRVLAALLEEFPLSAGLAPEIPQGFFGSPPFHRAVQQRGSLAEALGEAFAAHQDAAVAAMARLEEAVARARRSLRGRSPSRAGYLRLSPAARVLDVPSGSLALMAALRAGESAPPLGPGTECVLVIGNEAGEATLEPLAEGLAVLLRAAAVQGGVLRDRLLELARSHGAEASEAQEILAALVADGVLL